MAKIERQIEIRRPAEAVFDFLADGENEMRWRVDIRESRKVSDGPVGVGTTYRYTTRPGDTTSTWAWSELDRPRLLAWTDEPVERETEVGHAHNAAAKIQPAGRYELKPTDGGTRLTVGFEPHLATSIPLLGPLTRWLAGRKWARQLRRLKQALERE
jgi:uncharacterized protein YndB with AHSA1/START domain